jgi:hypothetical protein
MMRSRNTENLMDDASGKREDESSTMPQEPLSDALVDPAT